MKRKAEEQRIQEELEAKEREEKEKKRLAEEKKRLELEAKLAEEERQRLAIEEPKVTNWNSNFIIEIKKIYAKIEEQQMFDKLLACDTLPDPRKENQLNEYLSMWNELKDKSIESCVQSCQVAYTVSKRILECLAEAQANRQYDQVAFCWKFISLLWSTTRIKYDEFSAYVIQHIDQYLIKSEKEIKNTNDQQQKKNPKATKESSNIKEECTLKCVRDDNKLGLYLNYGVKIFRYRPIDFEELTIMCDMPRTIMSISIIMRASWTSFDDFTAGTYFPYFVVGGVVNVELFSFPSLPRSAKKWVIRQIYSIENTLDRKPYPEPNSQNVNPLKVIYKLPDYVFIPETDTILKVGYWDFKQKQWAFDGIEEIKFDKPIRNLSFTTVRLAPLALLFDRATDFPYKSWKVRCVNKEVAIVDIVTKRTNFSFEIGCGYAKLIDRMDNEFSHLINKEFTSPGTLLYELLACGVNLIPLAEDTQLKYQNAKEIPAEERAILDIVKCVDGFAFRSSKWNPTLDKNQIIIKVRENLEYDREFHEDHEKEWTYMMWYANKCHLVSTKDTDEKCDPRIKEGEVAHACLQITLEKYAKEMALQRCGLLSQSLFFETLTKFLRMTRLIAYS